jgi:hypothetical protein
VSRRNGARWKSIEFFRKHWPTDYAVSKFFYTLPQGYDADQRLTFRTLSGYLEVLGLPFKRTRLYNMQEAIWRLAVRDKNGKMAGYIDIPDPGGSSNWKIHRGSQQFVVLSRSTIDGKIEPGPDPFDLPRAIPSPAGSQTTQTDTTYATARDGLASEIDMFDTAVYDKNRPWCMFNVMMLRCEKGVASRQAIGRIHVDAFMACFPTYEIVTLE